MTAPDTSSSLRISLTLPGSASLGAFQAGAVAALDVALRRVAESGTTVHIDAVGGSSAGSIVALLYVHCLTTGRDCRRLLRQAWVEEVDVGLLSSGGSKAPLGFDPLEGKLRRFLQDRESFPFGVYEISAGPTELQVGLTTLQGFTRHLETHKSTCSSLDYADSATFVLEPGAGVDAVVEPRGRSPLDAVLTSATHPGAFAPRLLDRSADLDRLRSTGVNNLPDAGLLWYTDGGVVESKPIGKVVEAARRIAGNAEGATRLHLVIDPRSSGASGHEQWSDPDDPKGWLEGLRRSLAILPTQALHDDVRSVARINHRITAVEELCDELMSEADGHKERSALLTKLHRAAGTDGKEMVSVEMITPLLVANDRDGDGIGDLLAGDFIGAFGGFLNQDVRQSDFRLGWRCTREWMSNRLHEYGCDQETVDSVVGCLDEVRDASWPEEEVDAEGLQQLSIRDRWQLTKLAVRAGSQMLRSALPTPSLPWAEKDEE